MRIYVTDTDIAEAEDGTRYVFGPGEYDTDNGLLTNKMARKLIKKDSARELKEEVTENVDQ